MATTRAPRAGSWRAAFAPRIARVLTECEGLPEKEIRKQLRALWDSLLMGERRMWPYRVFCDEIQRQTHPPPPPPAKQSLEPENLLLAREEI